jgi:hypothetical protein
MKSSSWIKKSFLALAVGTSLSLLSACLGTETETERVVVGGPDSVKLAREGKPFELRFYPQFGTDTLKLGKKYRTAGGDSVRVEFARFYISEISLIDTLGAEHPLLGLFLIDELDSLARARGYASVTIQALPGTYRGIRYSVGVPSSLNHRDAATQSAPLGMASDMWWGWNPGYIFNRTEGKVDSAGTSVSLAYHIGGDTRKLGVNLYSLTGTATTLVVSSTGGSASVNVKYDALFSKGLNTSAPLKPSVNTGERQAHGGPILDQMYLNSAAMFAIRQFSGT